jgi:hypothetical protein
MYHIFWAESAVPFVLVRHGLSALGSNVGSSQAVDFSDFAWIAYWDAGQGHASVVFTLQTYRHVQAEMRKPAWDAMERLFGGVFRG